MNLDAYSYEEIENELEKRQNEEKNKHIPKQVQFSDKKFKEIVNYAIENNRSIINYGVELKDFDHHIYEKTMRLIFGDEYFEFVNRYVQ